MTTTTSKTTARHLVSTLALAASLMLGAGPGTASPRTVKRVQRPGAHAFAPGGVAAAQAARKPGRGASLRSRNAVRLTKRASALGDAAFADPQFRQELVNAPLVERLGVFIGLAEASGKSVPRFKRRLEGMRVVGGVKTLVSVEKTFFNVTSETYALLPKTMGEHVVWFTGNQSPGHLHTLLADQDGGGRFSHNTYGKRIDLATVTAGYTQISAPVQLTGPEMDRFVRYLNAGVREESKAAQTQARVYGFKTSTGDLVCDTRCTNWATTAPIGDLEPWAAAVDQQIADAAAAGHLSAGYEKGLHARFAATLKPAQRAKLARSLKANPHLSAETKAAVAQLAEAFDFQQTNFPGRPRDLVARQSLASVVGVTRSQDPAKFLYDLVMSDRVPVVAVIAQAPLENFASLTLDLEIMGKIAPDGKVRDGNGAVSILSGDQP